LLIENGANAVQMYSAVVYEGPLVAKDIKNKISFSN
jgi:dihydroorotate dehydrogenase